MKEALRALGLRQMHGRPLSALQPVMEFCEDIQKHLQKEFVAIGEIGIGARRRTAEWRGYVYRDAIGDEYALVDDEYVIEPCALDLDYDDLNASFERIAGYARLLLDGFGLPYVGKRFRRDENGEVLFYFWEDQEGLLQWGENPPPGYLLVEQSSYVSPEMADRIVDERGGLHEFSSIVEIPYAAEFLETCRLPDSEKRAWLTRRSDRPETAPEMALDIGIMFGCGLGELVAEWRIAGSQEKGKPIFDRQKQGERAIGGSASPLADDEWDKLFEEAHEMHVRNPSRSMTALAEQLAKQFSLPRSGRPITPGTIRNELGKNKERWKF